jgi:anti-sigma factor RsiW
MAAAEGNDFKLIFPGALDGPLPPYTRAGGISSLPTRDARRRREATMSERQMFWKILVFFHRSLLAAVGVGMVGLLLSPGTARGELSREQAAQALATLQRGWVANAGQWDARAAFSAPGYFVTTWVTKDGELRHRPPGCFERPVRTGFAV